MLKQDNNFFSFPLPVAFLMETSQEQHLSCCFILWALWLRSLTSIRSSDCAVIAGAGYNSDRKHVLVLSLHMEHIPKQQGYGSWGKDMGPKTHELSTEPWVPPYISKTESQAQLPVLTTWHPQIYTQLSLVLYSQSAPSSSWELRILQHQRLGRQSHCCGGAEAKSKGSLLGKIWLAGIKPGCLHIAGT